MSVRQQKVRVVLEVTANNLENDVNKLATDVRYYFEHMTQDCPTGNRDTQVTKVKVTEIMLRT